jgi:hypothetical protein
MIETWKAVVGFEGQYEVSDLGRVRSVDRIEHTFKKTGTPYTRSLKGKLLKPFPVGKGYMVFSLGLNNQQFVHVIVLKAFVGPAPEGCEGRHLDDVKSNNALLNLCWGTPLENAQDSIRNGTKPRGERVGGAKLTSDIVRSIRSSGRPTKEIAAEFGVVRSTVIRILSKRTWKHLDISSQASSTENG